MGTWLGGTSSWGEYRVPIWPTEVANRSNMFIHGGDVYGYRGCIDLGPNGNSLFLKLMKTVEPIPLIVNYESSKNK